MIHLIKMAFGPKRNFALSIAADDMSSTEILV